MIIFIFLAAINPLRVGYTKARAEGLGVECEAGLFACPKRVVILAIGLLSQLVSGLLLSWRSYRI